MMKRRKLKKEINKIIDKQFGKEDYVIINFAKIKEFIKKKVIYLNLILLFILLATTITIYFDVHIDDSNCFRECNKYQFFDIDKSEWNYIDNSCYCYLLPSLLNSTKIKIN